MSWIRDALPDFVPNEIFGVQMPWAPDREETIPPVQEKEIEQERQDLEPEVREEIERIEEVLEPIDPKASINGHLNILVTEQTALLTKEANRLAQEAEGKENILSQINNLYSKIVEATDSSNGSCPVSDTMRATIETLRREDMALPLKEDATVLSKDDKDALLQRLSNYQEDYRNDLQKCTRQVQRCEEKHNTFYQFVSSLDRTIRETIKKILGRISP